MKSQLLPEEQANILSSIDRIKRAEAPPYFYTRLLARMEREQNSQTEILEGTFGLTKGWSRTLSLSLLAVFLVFNSILIMQLSHQYKQGESQSSTIEQFAAEYNMNVSGVYDPNTERYE